MSGVIDGKLLLSGKPSPILLNDSRSEARGDLACPVRAGGIDNQHLVSPIDRPYRIGDLSFLVECNNYGRDLHRMNFRRLEPKLKVPHLRHFVYITLIRFLLWNLDRRIDLNVVDAKCG